MLAASTHSPATYRAVKRHLSQHGGGELSAGRGWILFAASGSHSRSASGACVVDPAGTGFLPATRLTKLQQALAKAKLEPSIGDLASVVLSFPGDFAVAVADDHAPLRLIAGRLGLPRLYVAATDDVSLASTDLALLLRVATAVHGYEPSPNVDYCAHFLLALPVSDLVGALRPSAYSGIWYVPAGHAVELATSHRLHRYWSYWEQPPLPARAAVDAVRESIATAVADRSSTGKTGVLLSGGLDSSVVAVMLRDVSGPGSYLYNNSFPGASSLDEEVYVQAVAAATSGALRQIESNDLWALKPTRQPPRRIEPYEGWFAAQEEAVAEAAECDGVSILLDGLGGDELFAPSFDGGSFGLGLTALHAQKRKIDLVRVINGLRRNRRPTRWDIGAHGPLLPPFIGPSILERARAISEYRDVRTALSDLGVDAVTGARIASLQCTSDYIEDKSWHNHEIFNPRGVVRMSPLLDERVVTAVFQAPVSYVLHPALAKRLLRDAMRPWLPDSLYRRKHKVTFEAMLRRGVSSAGHEVGVLERMFQESPLYEFGWIDRDLFRRFAGDLFLRDRPERRNWPALKYWVWQAIALDRWVADAFGGGVRRDDQVSEWLH